jgi:hypothetical protein
MFECGAAEHRKPPGVVRVITTGGSIELLPIEELRRIDEGYVHPLGERSLINRDVLSASAERNRNTGARRARRFDAAISREHQRHGMPRACKRVRQRSGDLGKASRLGERMRLGSNHQY